MEREIALRLWDWYIDQFKPRSIIDFNCEQPYVLESAFYRSIKNEAILKGCVPTKQLLEATPSEFRPFTELLEYKYYIDVNQYDCVYLNLSEDIPDDKFIPAIVSNLSRAVTKSGFVVLILPKSGYDNQRELMLSEMASYSLKLNTRISRLIQAHWQVLGADDKFYQRLCVFNK